MIVSRSLSSTNNILVGRYRWTEFSTNYVEFLAVNTIQDNDIVFGEVTVDSNNNITGFDLSKRKLSRSSYNDASRDSYYPFRESSTFDFLKTGSGAYGIYDIKLIDVSVFTHINHNIHIDRIVRSGDSLRIVIHRNSGSIGIGSVLLDINHTISSNYRQFITIDDKTTNNPNNLRGYILLDRRYLPDSIDQSFNNSDLVLSDNTIYFQSSPPGVNSILTYDSLFTDTSRNIKNLSTFNPTGNTTPTDLYLFHRLVNSDTPISLLRNSSGDTITAVDVLNLNREFDRTTSEITTNRDTDYLLPIYITPDSLVRNRVLTTASSTNSNFIKGTVQLDDTYEFTGGSIVRILDDNDEGIIENYLENYKIKSVAVYRTSTGTANQTLSCRIIVRNDNDQTLDSNNYTMIGNETTGSLGSSADPSILTFSDLTGDNFVYDKTKEYYLQFKCDDTSRAFDAYRLSAGTTSTDEKIMSVLFVSQKTTLNTSLDNLNSNFNIRLGDPSSDYFAGAYHRPANPPLFYRDMILDMINIEVNTDLSLTEFRSGWIVFNLNDIIDGDSPVSVSQSLSNLDGRLSGSFDISPSDPSTYIYSSSGLVSTVNNPIGRLTIKEKIPNSRKLGISNRHYFTIYNKKYFERYLRFIPLSNRDKEVEVKTDSNNNISGYNMSPIIINSLGDISDLGTTSSYSQTLLDSIFTAENSNTRAYCFFDTTSGNVYFPNTLPGSYNNLNLVTRVASDDLFPYFSIDSYRSQDIQEISFDSSQIESSNLSNTTVLDRFTNIDYSQNKLSTTVSGLDTDSQQFRRELGISKLSPGLPGTTIYSNDYIKNEVVRLHAVNSSGGIYGRLVGTYIDGSTLRSIYSFGVTVSSITVNTSGSDREGYNKVDISDNIRILNRISNGSKTINFASGEGDHLHFRYIKNNIKGFYTTFNISDNISAGSVVGTDYPAIQRREWYNTLPTGFTGPTGGGGNVEARRIRSSTSTSDVRIDSAVNDITSFLQYYEYNTLANIVGVSNNIKPTLNLFILYNFPSGGSITINYDLYINIAFNRSLFD